METNVSGYLACIRTILEEIGICESFRILHIHAVRT